MLTFSRKGTSDSEPRVDLDISEELRHDCDLLDSLDDLETQAEFLQQLAQSIPVDKLDCGDTVPRSLRSCIASE